MLVAYPLTAHQNAVFKAVGIVANLLGAVYGSKVSFAEEVILVLAVDLHQTPAGFQLTVDSIVEFAIQIEQTVGLAQEHTVGAKVEVAKYIGILLAGHILHAGNGIAIYIVISVAPGGDPAAQSSLADFQRVGKLLIGVHKVTAGGAVLSIHIGVQAIGLLVRRLQSQAVKLACPEIDIVSNAAGNIHRHNSSGSGAGGNLQSAENAHRIGILGFNLAALLNPVANSGKDSGFLVIADGSQRKVVIHQRNIAVIHIQIFANLHLDRNIGHFVHTGCQGKQVIPGCSAAIGLSKAAQILHQGHQLLRCLDGTDVQAEGVRHGRILAGVFHIVDEAVHGGSVGDLTVPGQRGIAKLSGIKIEGCLVLVIEIQVHDCKNIFILNQLGTNHQGTHAGIGIANEFQTIKGAGGIVHHNHIAVAGIFHVAHMDGNGVILVSSHQGHPRGHTVDHIHSFLGKGKCIGNNNIKLLAAHNLAVRHQLYSNGTVGQRSYSSARNGGNRVIGNTDSDIFGHLGRATGAANAGNA